MVRWDCSDTESARNSVQGSHTPSPVTPWPELHTTHWTPLSFYRKTVVREESQGDYSVDTSSSPAVPPAGPGGTSGTCTSCRARYSWTRTGAARPRPWCSRARSPGTGSWAAAGSTRAAAANNTTTELMVILQSSHQPGTGQLPHWSVRTFPQTWEPFTGVTIIFWPN